MKKWKPLVTNLLLAVGAAGWLALVMPSSASASAIVPSSFTSPFTISNLQAGTANYGNLGISCTGSSCTVTLNPNGTNFFGNNFLGFDLAAGATNLTLSSAFVAAGGSTGGAGNFDGFGSFTQSLSLPDGPNSGFTSSITLFTVDYTGTADTLLVGNGGGGLGPTFDAAGHVFFTAGPQTGNTGYVGEPPPGGAVPEPSSLLLFGFGGLAVGFVMRRHLMPGED